MKAIINLICALTLAFNTVGCGQQGNQKSAGGAVDSESVMVNRVETTKNADGEDTYIGKIGIIEGGKYQSQDALDALVEAGDVEFLSKEELVGRGITIESDSLDNDGTSTQIVPLAAAAIGFLFGWALFAPRYTNRVYYNTTPYYYYGHSYNYGYSRNYSYSYRATYWY